MKLLFVADLHYGLKQLDWLQANAAGSDAVIIGGDLLDIAGTLDLDIQAVVVEQYLQRIRQLTRVIVSSGNHDGDGRDADGESRARWLSGLKADRLHVDGDSVDVDGTRITVCPWWDGPVSRAEVENQLLAAVPPDGMRWIWVHHSPPDGPLSWTGKAFAGDGFLNEWIERFQPDLVLCGHIHSAPFHAGGAWAQRFGKSWAFNPGREIGEHPTSLWLDLKEDTACWISSAGVEVRSLR